MSYVAARGGEQAIEQSERLYRERLGKIDATRVNGIARALPWLVDRIMGEASLYAPRLAALALAQSGGDLYEAVLLLRAWRTTQPRLAVAEPLTQDNLFTHRRISAAFKDIPGGQILGPTLDYSHRILRTDILEGADLEPEPVEMSAEPAPPHQPWLASWQKAQGLVVDFEREDIPKQDIPDLTREPLLFPASRAHRLQSLARADTGGLMALGYAVMRGYGPSHPTVNELRLVEADVEISHPRGTVFSAGRVRVSQAEVASKAGAETIDLGFCATLGWNEVKIIAGGTLDLNEQHATKGSPFEEEFFLSHTEPVEGAGFCQHFKLPHYVTFQSTLDAMRDARRKQAAKASQAVAEEPAE